MVISEYSLDEVDREKWDRLVEESPNSTPFSHWSWLQLMKRGLPGWHVHCVVAEDGGRLLGGMPLVESAALGVRQSHSMAYGTPAGPLTIPGADPRLTSDLLTWWVDRHAAGVHATRLSVAFDDVDPPGLDTLTALGFRTRLHTAYRISLAGRTFEEWERSLSQHVRNKNRQALDRGGSFERVEDPRAASEIAALAKRNARRHGRRRIPYGEPFYRALLEQPGRAAAGLARVVLVRVDGRASAYNLCVVHRGRMWLIDHGADTADFSARPNNLIYRSIVQAAFEEGLEEIDMGAVPPGADALATFKHGLGGHPWERLSAIRSNIAFRLALGVSRLLGR